MGAADEATRPSVVLAPPRRNRGRWVTRCGSSPIAGAASCGVGLRPYIDERGGARGATPDTVV